MTKKRLLSGVKPTGRPHIGNYFGAMKQFVDLQDQGYEVYAMIADVHALNFIQNHDEMQQSIYDLLLDYLAIGLDPKKVTLFQQSAILEHTFLGWVFNAHTSLPYMMRAHSYKDSVAKDTLADFSAGDFTYPTLMAADILLYSPDIVPVGSDQKQHIEFAVDFAEKFNRIYGETFKLPKEHILESVGTLPGNDGRKMSKSYNNHLPLFATEAETEKYIMSVAMDSKVIEDKKNPDEYALYQLAKPCFTPEQEAQVRLMFTNGGVGYGEIKKHIAVLVNLYFRSMRERRAELVKDKKKVLAILEEGTADAQKVATAKAKEVREALGYNLK